VYFQQAPQSEKLPTMYLIDSIMKNLTDSNYLQLFSKNIVSTFVAVFEKVTLFWEIWAIVWIRPWWFK